MRTVIQEIGSEFWLEREPVLINRERDGVYVLSGRTAIDLIIQEISKTRNIRNVYMPAYSCDSMIMPFINRGIEVELYDMSFDGQLNYHIDFTKDIDVFYVNNYFGYENTIDKDIIEHFKAKGALILYDRTHSFLLEDESVDADYSFVSIRKWMGVVCGAEVKGVESKNLESCPYLEVKENAMKMKRAFIHGDTSIEKSVFLNLYAEFGHHLAEDYRNYEMDNLSYGLYQSTDWNEVRHQRIINAQYLHDNLNFTFMGRITENCCPIFIPIIFSSKEERNRARQLLIANNIYCPIHWPKNLLVTPEMEANRIIDTELSLICDQRYGVDDMERIVNVLSNIN